MLFTIAATAYCTLTYVAGFYFFKVKEPSVLSVGAWVLSPVTVPAALLLVSVVG